MCLYEFDTWPFFQFLELFWDTEQKHCAIRLYSVNEFDQLQSKVSTFDIMIKPKWSRNFVIIRF